MFVTSAVSHDPMGWSNALADSNIQLREGGEETGQPGGTLVFGSERAGCGGGHGRNGRSAAHAASHTNLMSANLAVSHDPMGWLNALVDINIQLREVGEEIRDSPEGRSSLGQNAPVVVVDTGETDAARRTQRRTRTSCLPPWPYPTIQ